MHINILLPHKEKFSINSASSVSITVMNNFNHSKYKKLIRIFGQNVSKPLINENFIGIKNPTIFFKSKNKNLADKMCRIINKTQTGKKIIEIHNRPYLVNKIFKKTQNKVITLFFHNDPLSMRGSKSIIERNKLLQRVDKVICVSNFIKNKFLRDINDNHDKVTVLYNGIERQSAKFPKKKKQIIYVGRIVKEKGVHLYTKAVKEIAHKFKEWKFLIIGSYKLGDKETSIFSKQIIQEFNNIGLNTKVLGFLSNQNVKQIMSESSLIVIPSLWDEPFGLVAAEAMSCGVGIISSNSGGLPEIIKESGILIENINEKKIVSELEKVLSSNEKLKKLQKLSWNNFELFSSKTSKELDIIRKKLFLR